MVHYSKCNIFVLDDFVGVALFLFARFNFLQRISAFVLDIALMIMKDHKHLAAQ